MPRSTSNRIVQNAVQFIFAPAWKKPEYYRKNEGLSLVDASFAPTNSPRPLQKKNWPCHPLPLVMRVSMKPTIHSLTRYASGIRGGETLGVSLEQASKKFGSRDCAQRRAPTVNVQHWSQNKLGGLWSHTLNSNGCSWQAHTACCCDRRLH